MKTLVRLESQKRQVHSSGSKMTREMIIERLTWVAKAKPGDMQPPWMGRPGDWASPLSSLAQETLNLIEHYEKVLKDSNETILF